MRCNLCEVVITEDKIRSRKMLNWRNLQFVTFMYDLYLPSLEKYIYHVHHVQILSKNLCWRLRHNVKFKKTIYHLQDKDDVEMAGIKK